MQFDTTQYPPSHWQDALKAAEAALAVPAPDRSRYSRGEFGEDRYQFAYATWQGRRNRARQLQRLAKKMLAVAS